MVQIASTLVVLASLSLLRAGSPSTASDSPKKRQAPNKDRYGDSLPRGALQRLGTIRYRQEWPVTSFAFAPDGNAFATAANTYDGTNCTVRLWEIASGKEIRCYSGAPGYITQIALAPDGKSVAAACTRDVAIWDVASGAKVRQFQGQPQGASCLAWSPDGTTLAVGGAMFQAGWQAGASHSVRLFDARTGKLIRVLDKHRTMINAVAFSLDGKRLGSSSADRRIITNGATLVTPGCVCTWDIATGQVLHQLDHSASHVEGTSDFRKSVAFSPDLARVAFRVYRGKADLQVWDIKDGKKLWSVEGGGKSFQFSADGKYLVIGSESDATQILGASTGQQVRSLVGHDGSGFHVAGIDPTGKYLAMVRSSVGLNVGLVRLWQLADGKELEGPEAHLDAVLFARALAGSDYTVTAGRDGSLRLWRSTSGEPAGELAGYLPWRLPTLAANGSRLMAVPKQGAMHLFDLPQLTGRPIPGLDDVTQSGFALSPDGKMLAVSASPSRGPNTKGLAHLMEVDTGRLRGNLGPASGSLMVFSADGQLLVSAAGTIRLWQRSTAKELIVMHAPIVEIDRHQPNPGYNRYWDAAFSPDGRWLARSGTFSHKGRQLSKLTIWEVATGQIASELADESYIATGIAFASDGLTLVTCSGTEARRREDREAHFWDLPSGKLTGTLHGQYGSVTAVAFSPEGGRLLTGATDGTVVIWDAAALPKAQAPAARALTPADLAGLWDDLAGLDGRKAYQAIAALSAGRENTVEFLRTRLQPAKQLPHKELDRLVAALGDPVYAVRVKAFAALQAQGALALATVRSSLKERITLEVRQRLSLLLAKLESFTPPPAELRTLRAVAVLEGIGTADAVKLIDTLAKGADDARLTREVRAARDRLGKR